MNKETKAAPAESGELKKGKETLKNKEDVIRLIDSKIYTLNDSEKDIIRDIIEEAYDSQEASDEISSMLKVNYDAVFNIVDNCPL
jgi:hypothetical protein